MKRNGEEDKKIIFQKCRKTCIITVKPKKYWRYQVSYHSQHILSHIVSEKKDKLINKILTKIEQKYLWILTLFIRGCWGCLRSKKFHMVDQAYISTTQDHTKLNQKTNNSKPKSHEQFKTSRFALKHPVSSNNFLSFQ